MRNGHHIATILLNLGLACALVCALIWGRPAASAGMAGTLVIMGLAGGGIVAARRIFGSPVGTAISEDEDQPTVSRPTAADGAEKIVRNINEIATRTNLCTLNAPPQAAQEDKATSGMGGFSPSRPPSSCPNETQGHAEAAEQAAQILARIEQFTAEARQRRDRSNNRGRNGSPSRKNRQNRPNRWRRP
ncbi:hypothetical protein CSA17_05015 [bacterium DOLJORAL78_65_58]|nr:MAG: hypothetical protein CSB20_04485 [bacterium DOLZORAL124_64_63]PIE75909.1 MAG: hypothetical protein CSA17_05015 [bacterium DOLJORAL78_65_58]